MSSNLITRMLGVLGVHAATGALYWAVVEFGFAKQSSLAPDLIERLDGDPAPISAYVDEMTREVLLAGIGGLLVSAVLACLWLALIDRSPPIGDKSARGKRGSWAGLMILALVAAVGLFCAKVVLAPIATLLAASVPVNTAGLGVIVVALGYWLSTAAFAPASTKVAVPGGSLFGG